MGMLKGINKSAEAPVDAILRGNFAERIGGETYGTGTAVYKFEKIKRAKRAAMAANPDVQLIDLGIGEPDEGANPEVVEVLHREALRAENRFYSDNGVSGFCESASRYLQKRFALDVDSSTQINHVVGTKNAFAMIPFMFINPGDVTLMTVPGYPVMGTATKNLGGEVYNLPLEASNNFFPQFDTIPKEVLKRAKLLYLNYPNNPTGAVATTEFLQRAIDFARKNSIVIVSDVAYCELIFPADGASSEATTNAGTNATTGTNATVMQPSILTLPGGMDCAIEVYSLSKTFNMTGWRLGFVVGSPLMVSAFASVKDNFDSGQFRPIQHAGAYALDNAHKLIPPLVEKYGRRLRGLHRVVVGAGFEALPPQGTFYLYVKAPAGVVVDGVETKFADAGEFCSFLIREGGIVSVPWDDAGAYVRFSATFEAATLEGESKLIEKVGTILKGFEFTF